jgi:hypothetical protein
MNIPSKHIPLAELADLAEQRTPAKESATLAAHLASCPTCTEQLKRLEQVFGLMMTDTSEDAPRDVIAGAIGLFHAASQQEQSLLRRVLAVLSFDSLNVAPAFGTRSGQTTSRQMLYSAEDNDIDLHITAQDNSWVVAGQVLGQDCNNGAVEIEGEGVSVCSTLNDSCEFILPAVPSGSYHLRLRFSDIEVEVPRLELRT